MAGYVDGAAGRLYWRSWQTDAPVAVLVLVHGFGEHADIYERYVAELGPEIEVWSFDLVGHGRSDGPRGLVSSIDVLVADALLVAGLARAARPGLPVFLSGHSLGATASAVVLGRDQEPWAGAVLSAAAIEPPEWVTSADPADGLALAPADLSQDPWYLGRLADDPLAFTESEGGPLEALREAWSELVATFSGVRRPVLFVHGSDDVVVPVEGARRWAAGLPDARLAELAGMRHDVLNDTEHLAVAEVVRDFVLTHAQAIRAAEKSQDARQQFGGSAK